MSSVDVQKVNEKEEVVKVVEKKVEENKENKYNNKIYSFDDIKLRESYIIIKSSLGELIKQVSLIQIIEKDNNNNYTKLLSEFFKTENKILIDSYKNIISKTNCYDLVSPLPRGVVIKQNVKSYITLNKAKLGDIIKAVYQRIDFISSRETPIFYLRTAELTQKYKNMQAEIINFKKSVQDYERKFVEICTKAHSAIGK